MAAIRTEEAPAAVFAREVAAGGRAWTVRDRSGFPAPMTASGVRAHPFWSTLERVGDLIRAAPAYARCQPHEVPWEDFARIWAPGMAREGLRVGLNWAGPRALGPDLTPADVLARVAAALERSRAGVP